MLRKVVSLILLVTLSLTINAGLKDLPVKTIGGEKYYIYTVEAGEGLYAISKKLDVKISDIEKYNSISGGLKLGQELKFPTSLVASTAKRAYKDYKAKKGDSLYGICKEFGMTEDEFFAANTGTTKIQADKTYKVFASAAEAKAMEAKAHDKEAPKAATTKEAAAAEVATHIIEQGETLFSIAQQHGCTLTELLKLNPGLEQGHYEIGQSIIVPTAYTSQASQKVASAFRHKKYHVVKNAETFYGIARNYGVSIEQLQNANPGKNVLNAGDVLYIPDSCDEPRAAEQSTMVPATEPTEPIVAAGMEEEKIPMPNEVIEVPKPMAGNSLAIILSTLSKDEKESERQASANFYRGFMLAVDTIKTAIPNLKVVAYDWRKTPERLKEILRKPEMLEVKYIIAPNDPKAIEMLCEFAADKDIKVLNLFYTKDTSYQTIPNLYQANIPYDMMVDKAIAYIAPQISNAKLVVLKPKGHTDKIDVVNKLVAAVKPLGVEVITIDYTDKLQPSNLEKLNKDADYVFISTTSKSQATTDMLSKLSSFKQNNKGEGQVSVLGYPEWTLLKGPALKNMNALNATIYSRFYNDASDRASTDIAEMHKYYYGRSIPSAIPKLALTGYDVGIYLLKAMMYGDGIDESTPLYDGVQNPFHFTNVDGGGWVNDCIYIVKFSPDGTIEKTAIR